MKNISNYRESSPRLNPTTKVITIKKNDNAYLFGQQLNTRLTVTDWGAIYGTHEFTLQKDNALIINTKTIGTTLSKIVKIVICREDTDDAGVIDEIQSADIVKYISIHPPHTGTTSDNIQYYDLQLDANDINLIADGIDEDNFYTYTLKMQLKFNSYNSFAPFTLNSLWNNEYNLLEEILKYMKMHRILIIVDSLNKKVRFIPAWKFYQNYTITDWTDKVDYSKEYKIQPVTWEDKYVLFGYKDDERDIISKYLKKYGINYGAIRLITDYNFNNETNKLFDNVPIPLISSDNILSWVNLYERLEIVYTVANETYVNCKNDNKDFVDEFGAFYMFEGLNNFDTADVMRNVLVSDDTSFQMDAEKYFYSQSFMSEPAPPTYPLLSDAKTVFTLPKELYTYGHVGQTTGSTNDGIYDAIWENYINERYNSNNKLVTCYVHINPTDYCNFEFNHFVKIENQLYAVNKIYDYDIDSGEPTKVDLITVQNLTNYYTNNL